MAVTVTRIDSQNVGLRLLGQTSVSPLSLDLTTGEVASDYLPVSDLPTLQQFALNLFQIVPKSSRSAAAIGLLSRLCAVSPADASTVSLAATVTAGVATLNASVTSSPASLILTTPFAMTGGVMPSSGGGSSPAPPPSGDSNVVNVPGTGLGVGELVSIDSTGNAQLADCSAASHVPCMGIVDSIVDGATISVRVSGVKTGLSGLTAGRIYFLGELGALELLPPTTPGYYVQPIGFALSSSTLAVAPSTALAVR